MLGNAARLAGGDFRRADEIQERGLAVIHVAHHGDDRGTRLLLTGLARHALQFVLDLVLAHDFGRVAHLLSDENGRLRLDRLIDGRHDPQIHEDFDDFGRLDRHLLRKLGNGDRLPDRHFTTHRGCGHLKRCV